MRGPHLVVPLPAGESVLGDGTCGRKGPCGQQSGSKRERKSVRHARETPVEPLVIVGACLTGRGVAVIQRRAGGGTERRGMMAVERFAAFS
jgi:hypothetical protein